MESLRWRRFLLLPWMPVALVLFLGGVTTEVTGFGYLESLTTPSSLPSSVTAKAKESAILLSTTKTTTTTNYLDSLRRHHNPDEGVAAATTTTSSPTTTEAIAIASTDCWAAETIAEIPDDHYSKDHPGAGWAGYQHPMYGGYLDNLTASSSSSTENNSSSKSNNSSSNDNNDGTAAAAATPDAPSTTTSASCVLEVGKKADYGDDIRWGAQVYLDNLKK